MLKCFYMDIEEVPSKEQITAFEQILPKERMMRQRQLQKKERAVSFLLTSAFMQYGISVTLDIPMNEIVYQYGENGKPMLAEGVIRDGRTVDFNMSHSGRYAVLAVSDAVVGIDIEKRRHGRERVAERCFCRQEYEDIMSAATEEERDERFLRYWTMKEAYIKRVGKGLQIPLDSFRILRKEHSLSYVEAEKVFFAPIYMKEKAYAVSVCSESKEELSRILEITEKSVNSMQRITLEEMLKAL